MVPSCPEMNDQDGIQLTQAKTYQQRIMQPNADIHPIVIDTSTLHSSSYRRLRLLHQPCIDTISTSRYASVAIHHHNSITSNVVYRDII